MAVKTIGEILPKCPGKACHLPLDQIYENRQRHPELWGALLMACTKVQATAAAALWENTYPIDNETYQAWYALCEMGEAPRCFDQSPDGKLLAKLMFRAAAQGYVVGRRAS